MVRGMEKRAQVLLVKKAKKGDAAAFVQLCEAYQRVLYNSAYKILQNDHEVSDCLQETELRAWKKVRNLRNEAAFNSWIFRILVNVAKDMLKSREQAVPFEEGYWGSGVLAGDVREGAGGNNLDEALEGLPEQYKIPLVLHYYAGFKVQEIAEQLNIPKNTVKTRLARGRLKLKQLLEGE